ncbi:GNAT family N-acetyltransferase [Bacillus testis]|uniref:GNAT family N-acetyltransferase n=1 Tax=Bacillus testis TaxID=1622072 RepID=UPI00067EA43D|nr:GNAT family protein [Bacillus testis]
MRIEEMYSQLPELETERLLLRKLTAADTNDMYEYTSNENVSAYVTWDRHQSPADTDRFIQFVLNQYRGQKIAPWGIEYKQDKKLIGTIDFVKWNPAHYTAEIGYAISQRYWGQGITTEAAQAVIEFGFTNMRLQRIQARCLSENIGSEKVMVKCGMRYEGTLRKSMHVKGKQRDIKVYSILFDEYKDRKAALNTIIHTPYHPFASP